MVGIDITLIDRIEKMYNRFGDKGLSRFLSEKEIKQANGKVKSFAGYWAAKEAASKAIGTGISKDCGFHDIKIKKLPSGQPSIKYKKHIRKRFNIANSHLSITHDGNIAIAVVVNEIKK